MLIPKEPVTTFLRQRWEYCFDTETRRHLYLHVDCDMVADEKDNCCIGCGAPSPLAQLPYGTLK